MDFLDAAIALMEEKCEAIESLVTGEIFKIRNGRLYCNLGCNSNKTPIKQPNIRQPSIREIIGNWQLVNPKPIYEEVEVVKNLWIAHDGTEIIAESLDAMPIDSRTQVVKLTGKIKKEIKPKFKHRELIATCDEFGYISGSFTPRRANSKIWEEWEE